MFFEEHISHQYFNLANPPALSPAPSINLCSSFTRPSQQHHQPERYHMQTLFNMRSYYIRSVWNGWAIHLAAAVSLPSLAVSAIPSLPSPGAVGALPDATVSLSTPMERSTGRDAQPAVSIIHSYDKVWIVFGNRVGMGWRRCVCGGRGWCWLGRKIQQNLSLQSSHQ